RRRPAGRDRLRDGRQHVRQGRDLAPGFGSPHRPHPPDPGAFEEPRPPFSRRPGLRRGALEVPPPPAPGSPPRLPPPRPPRLPPGLPPPDARRAARLRGPGAGGSPGAVGAGDRSGVPPPRRSEIGLELPAPPHVQGRAVERPAEEVEVA